MLGFALAASLLVWDYPADGKTTGYVLYVGQAKSAYKYGFRDVGFPCDKAKRTCQLPLEKLPLGACLYIAATSAHGQSALADPVCPAGVVVPSSTATYVRIDTTTQGNWLGVYGRNGYAVAGDTTTLQEWTQPAGAQLWTWEKDAPAPRALRRANGSGRIAATWYAASSFSIEVKLADAQPHQLAVYAVDWDTTSRAERIDILDADSGDVLDSRSLSDFNRGRYVVWTVRGNVRITVTMTAGANAVISGVFLDDASLPRPKNVRLAPA